MTTEVLNYSFNGTGTDTKTAPGGVFFYVLVASAALNIRTDGRTQTINKFIGVGAGFRFGPGDESQRWRYLRIDSATAQNITLIVGDDPVEVANAVTIAGLVQVTQSPATGMQSVADVSVNAATQAPIAANLSRKSITIGNISTNAASFRIAEAAAAAANRGDEIQPGQTITYFNTGALSIFNTGAGAQSYTKTEQL
jgi:hypothetical protein